MFEAIAIGPILVWTRLLLLLLGIWISAEFLFRLAASARLSLKHFRDHAWLYAGAFILGGRLFAVIVQYIIYIKDPWRVLVLWDGNFSFIGAMFGIACVLFGVTKNHRTTFLQWLDVLLPVTCVGLAFDWLGRFASCTSYGRPTDAWWGVTCESIGVRFVVPIHPIQLYNAVFFAVLTVVLLAIRKYSQRAGAETLVGMFIATIFTFFIEYYRADFSKSVFFIQPDFFVLIGLFVSLGVFAAIEHRLRPAQILLAEAVLIAFVMFYLYIRLYANWFNFATHELRLSQFFAILVLLATIVYVVVHRQKYPHL